MPEQCREIRQVLEKLDEIEILLNTVLEELRELKRGRFEKQRGSFVDFLRERRYISITEIKSRQVLRQALEKGLVVVLKDEAANREIVVLKEVVRKLLERLPISIDDAERLEPREYELLQILNRLGYVLQKGGQYIKTELAEEFYI
ncbi:MAG: hypothetical protein QXK71_04475 [Pyrobaculum sp.]|jgi:hypothetical protein